MYALMRNEAKFFARDNRCDKTLRFEYSPFAPDTAEEILSAIALIEDWTGRSFKTYREENPSEQSPETFATLIEALPARIETMTSGASEAFAALGRAVLNAGQDILPFEVKADRVENSTRECLIRKPVRAWRAYKELLLWFAGREVARFAAEKPQAARWESLDADLHPDRHSRVGVQWENLGGLLASQPRLDNILGKAARGLVRDMAEVS